MSLADAHSDEFEIDPVDEADRKARLKCRGSQYWTVHRCVKMRRIGNHSGFSLKEGETAFIDPSTGSEYYPKT